MLNVCVTLGIIGKIRVVCLVLLENTEIILEMIYANNVRRTPALWPLRVFLLLIALVTLVMKVQMYFNVHHVYLENTKIRVVVCSAPRVRRTLGLHAVRVLQRLDVLVTLGIMVQTEVLARHALRIQALRAVDVPQWLVVLATKDFMDQMVVLALHALRIQALRAVDVL